MALLALALGLLMVVAILAIGLGGWVYDRLAEPEEGGGSAAQQAPPDQQQRELIDGRH
jgi:hypothetical protein